MPFRFDPTSQKVVEDNSTANTQNDLEAHTHRAPKSSHGKLLPPPGSSQSKLPAGKMDKSRQRITLGQKWNQPDLGPVLKRGLVIIGLIVLVMTVIIYAVNQQFKFTQSKTHEEASGQTEAALILPKGKKSPLAINQFLTKLAARADEEENYQASARLYGHAAEEARLGGPSCYKQYIDALFAQAEVYRYNLSDSDKARPILEKVLKAQQADSTTKPIKLANTYNDLADSLPSENDANKERIQSLYQKAISLAKSAADNKGHAYYCYNAGDYYCDQGQYDKALSLAKESLAAFTKIKDPALTDVADSHYLAARALSHMPGQIHFEQANGEYEVALKSYEKAETTEDRYANCMRDAAWIKLRLGQREEAKELFDKASAHNDDDDPGQSADSYMNDVLK